MTTDEMIAILQAAKEGKKIECQLRYDSDEPLPWKPCEPSWNFYKYNYRITTSPIAAGHNPDKLTEYQVGVKGGWRLLERDEIYDGRGATREIQVWNGQEWITNACFGDEPSLAYRTQKPPGYFLPKPKERKPLGPEDFPPGTVIRFPTYKTKGWFMLQAVGEDGLATFRCGKISFHVLLQDGAERSLDGGKTWLPCYKEE